MREHVDRRDLHVAVTHAAAANTMSRRISGCLLKVGTPVQGSEKCGDATGTGTSRCDLTGTGTSRCDFYPPDGEEAEGIDYH